MQKGAREKREEKIMLKILLAICHVMIAVIKIIKLFM